jgi:acetyl-CoA carboxylase beta subunit
MKTFALTTAFALATLVAAPAFASDQLARSLGLEPGVYTAAQLATIKGAMENSNSGDAHFIASLINRDVGGVVSTQSVGGSSQLARSIGLNGDYTLSEVATIKGAMENSNSGDAHFIASLKNRDNGGVVSTQSVSGSSQLARSIGLDGNFTAAQLATIKGAMENSNSGDAHFIADLIAAGQDVRG